MYIQIKLCLLRNDEAFIVKAVNSVFKSEKKKVIGAPLHPFCVAFMISSHSYSSLISAVYVSEEGINVYTHYIFWPVAYRIIQFAYSMWNIMNRCLLSMSDIILFSSTHHGCLIAGQCSIFKSATLKFVFCWLSKLCTDYSLFSNWVITCNTFFLLESNCTQAVDF